MAPGHRAIAWAVAGFQIVVAMMLVLTCHSQTDQRWVAGIRVHGWWVGGYVGVHVWVHGPQVRGEVVVVVSWGVGGMVEG